MTYGVEVSCTDQLVSSRLVRGPRIVVEALFRRLTTPRGMLGGGDEESTYGFDVAGYVGSVGTTTALATIPNQVRNECLKDDRVLSVDARTSTVDRGDGTQDLRIDVTGELAESDETFSFSVLVADVGLQLIGSIS